MTKQEVRVELDEQDKELLDKQFEEDLKNAKAELGRAKISLDEHEFVLKQHKDILELMDNSREVILNNMEVIDPRYKYETLPEYSALLKAQESLKFDQNYFMLKEQSIPGLEKTVKAKKEAIKSLSEKIEKMSGESNE